jgi:hypothetical protein
VAAREPDRPPLGARLREGFWASLFGAGVALWILGAVVGLGFAGVMGSDHVVGAFLLAAFGGVSVAVFSGFDRPLRGYASLARRLFFCLGVGGLLAFLAGFIVLYATLSSASLDKEVGFGALAAAGVALASGAALHFGWFGVVLDDVPADALPAARRRQRATFAALVFGGAVALFIASAAVRCYAGSAHACLVASNRAHGTDPAAELRYARLGCARGDAVLCKDAGSLVQRSGGDARDAESLLRRGCSLDGGVCWALNRFELEAACNAEQAFSCLALAREIGAGERERARELTAKACRLGLDEACVP